jgi:hypothetical protein
MKKCVSCHRPDIWEHSYDLLARHLKEIRGEFGLQDKIPSLMSFWEMIGCRTNFVMHFFSRSLLLPTINLRFKYFLKEKKFLNLLLKI